MKNKKTGCTIQLPFITVGILFVILKLCGAITWSWIWVLFPFILMFGFALIVFGLMIAVALIAGGK
jgi:hypothetical protein